ncbi:outer membrane beta-barrel protein [Hymenobacter sp. IS2118]|uniref:outer membrane beta-barrel protein n=1 Tax=Hymenobacter sp. IS2118 TaxID=1505605 RepID=UPI000552A14C|nr:outer membrane beta-barrel protein [Hymenobacter sp. IS2118]
MLLLRLLPGALLLAAPLLGHAQTVPATTAAAPRFYVGLAAYTSYYQNANSWRKGDGSLPVPLQLTAGYQLRPRLALELGVAYSGRTNRLAFSQASVDGNTGAPVNQQFDITRTLRTASVSALARYTLTRQPARRLQFDALGGFTLLHNSYRYRGFQGDDRSGTFQTTPVDQRSAYNDLLLTAGLGLRYRLAPRLDLNFDLTANRNLTSPSYSSHLGGLTGSAALGLRYRFGK